MVHLIRTNSNHPDFQKLVVLLDQDLAVRDGAEHAFYAQFNKSDLILHTVVACVDEVPVACGAFKEYDTKTVEIKRMYVQPEHRGKGIAGLVLQELETWATEFQYHECVLETGLKQPEAIRLYQKSGYSIIPNYGQYAGVENSVCMKKLLPF